MKPINDKYYVRENGKWVEVKGTPVAIGEFTDLFLRKGRSGEEYAYYVNDAETGGHITCGADKAATLRGAKWVCTRRPDVVLDTIAFCRHHYGLSPRYEEK